MAILKINNTNLPSPSDLQFGVQDIKKADRNARGRLISELIATKQKLDITWSFVTADDLKTILAAVAPNTFNATYIDPTTNALTTKEFYAGDRNVGVVDVQDGVVRYKDLRFSIIEV